jgi:hypothetical protein
MKPIFAALLIILVFIAGCSQAERLTSEPKQVSERQINHIYGNAVQKQFVPCAGSGCTTFDAFEVDGKSYFLVKDALRLDHYDGMPADSGYHCNNYDCAIYCKTGECYKTDNKGKTFVNGEIVVNPESSDVNLEEYILIK